MTGRNSRAMTPKLTPAQMRVFYEAYYTYRQGKTWRDIGGKKTMDKLQSFGLIVPLDGQLGIRYLRPSTWKITTDKGLSLAAELGFSARYEAEEQVNAAKHESDEVQQAAWRKLLEIPDTIAAPRIVDNEHKWSSLHYWSMYFVTGIKLYGRVGIHDTVIYEICLDNIRLLSTAEITEFLKEMYAANTLLVKLQTGLIGKAETKPYEPSVLALLPNKEVES